MQIGLIRQAKILFLKEIKTEWRNRYAINGILVQLVSAVFITNLCFPALKPMTWNALFWVIILFSAVNAIARSFIQERDGRLLYFHSLVNPLAVLYSKMLFNVILTVLISLLGLILFSLFLDKPGWDLWRYGTLVVLFSIGLGVLFTTISAIAAKTKAGGIIMPLLSFPLIIPMIVVAVSAGVMIVMGDHNNFLQNASILALLDVMIAVLASVMFKFLWQN
ncbi:MAG: heme exporter protein B [Bacteroidia bacterium]|jgi:heme exporter protein B